MARDAWGDRLRDPKSWVTPAVVVLAIVAAFIIGRGFGVPGVGGGASPADLPPAGSSSAEPTDPTDDPPSDIASDPTQCDPAKAPKPALDLPVLAATGDPANPLLSPRRVRRFVDLAVAAGASVISTVAAWPSLQAAPGDAYDFRALDRVVRVARSRGLEVKVRLDDVPTWAFGGASQQRPPETASQLRQWRGYVTRVLEHLRGRVSYVEVWEEPNLPKSWATGPDPAAFARLLRVSYKAVKAVDPDVSVVSGAPSGNDIGFLSALYDALEEQGGPTPFDLLGVHPWTDDAAPADYDESRRYERDEFGTYDGNFLGFHGLHEVMAEHGDEDLPIYISQFGYGTSGTSAVSDRQRAEYAVQALEAATCAGYVEVFSWYALFPSRFDPAAWSLVDRAFETNRTYRALRIWSHA